MSTTVEITIDDDGNISVGIGDGPSDDVSNMQPVASIQQALAMAKHLLAQDASGNLQAGGGQMDNGAATGGMDGSPNGTGGGTGPDAGGSVVQSPTQDSGATSQADGGGQNAQAIWDALAQINMPQN